MRPDILPEFWGKARSFRQRVIDGDTIHERCRNSVQSVLRRRLERGYTTWRLRDIPDQFRLWATPTFGQLGHASIVTGTKHHIHFAAPMLATTTGRLETWADGGQEPGVSVGPGDFHADAGAGHIWQDAPTHVAINLHAMARFYQRAFHASDAMLTQAIWATLEHYGDVLASADQYRGRVEFGLPVAGGGHWFGNIVRNHVVGARADHWTLTLDIRTFHADAEAAGLIMREARAAA